MIGLDRIGKKWKIFLPIREHLAYLLSHVEDRKKTPKNEEV